MRATTGLRVSAAALSAGIALLAASLPAHAASPAGQARALAGQLRETAAATAASGGPALPLHAFGSIVADPAHGHLFLSEGSTTGILVTTLAGNVVTTINQEAAGMTLSPDGTTLYAADPGSGEVLAIDTTTLAVTAHYAVGSDPVSVAVQDDKVWIGYQNAIGDIDLSANPPAFTAQPTMSGGWGAAPQLAADSSGSGALVAATTGYAASFDVSTATPTVRVAVTGTGPCSTLEDLAIAPGGSEFVLACQGQNNDYRFSTAALQQLGAYPSQPFPYAVAIAPDGTVAAGVDGWYAPDILVYHQDTTTALNKYELGGPTWNLVPKGLAWGGNAKLYAVVQSLSTKAYALRVLPDPEVTASVLTLGGTTSAFVGAPVTLKGKLTMTTGSLPAGASVAITRTGPGGTKRFTKAVTANAFTLTDRPPAYGSYLYTVSYAGDSSHQGTTEARKVSIVRKTVTITVSALPGTVNYGVPVTVTARLGKTATSRIVSIYAKSFGSTAERLLRTGRVNASGTLSVSYAPTRSTAFFAAFGGDAMYKPKTVKRNVYTHAKVIMTNSGWYTSTTINGTVYRVYHHSGHLNIAVKVAPNKHGECAVPESQEYDPSSGTWINDTTYGCGTLSAKSTVSGYLTLTNATGGQFRLRAVYSRSKADQVNLNGYSSWFYFTVVQ